MEPHADDSLSPAEAAPSLSLIMAETSVWPEDQHGQKGTHVFKTDYIVLERGNCLTSHTDETILPLQSWQKLIPAQGNGEVFSCAGTKTGDPFTAHSTLKELVPHPLFSQDIGTVHLPGEAGKDGVSSVNLHKG